MRVYPKDISTLEFDKIKAYLTNQCHGVIAQDIVARLKPISDFNEISQLLDEVSEFKTMLATGHALSIDYGMCLIRELNLLRIQGSVLTPDSFYQIKILAENIDITIRFFKSNPGVYPALSARVEGTNYDSRIVSLIDKVIDTDKSVRNNASDELYHIRLLLAAKRNELQRVFARAIQRLSKAGMLIDSEQSIRNGRKVLAIYAEHKRQVKGIIQGISDTGKSVYIEPEETVDLNNAIVELEQQERQEIYRILKELTERLASYHELLSQYQQIISNFDFIYAKAKVAVELNAVKPIIHKHSSLSIKNAVHPLLFLHNKKMNKPTIPLNVELNPHQRILVISGPNAGGKTICLKLAGLIQLMLQSGLLVPVAPESEMGLFQTLMVSIGDTQSIEYELSTYSAHLKMMKHFVLHADKHTLFLIDEFGTGSDPILGGAFAESILEQLAQQKAYGIVTTHYLNLKTLAERTEGIINGSMEFDEERLQPLYRLILGKPGSSYTFAIADRIGIPKSVVERARSLVKKDQYRLENLLRDLQREKQFLAQRIKEQKEEEQKLLQQKKEVLKLKASQEIFIEQEVNKRTRAQLLQIKETEKRLHQLIGQWNKTKDKTKLSQKIAEITMKHQPKKSHPNQIHHETLIKELNDKINIGDEVKVKTLNRIGRVVEVQKKKVVVNINGLPIAYDLSHVIKIERQKSSKESPTPLMNRGVEEKES